IEGLGNTYFIFGQPTDTLEQYQTRVVFQGNFETGEIHRILAPHFSTEPTFGNRIGEVSSVIPFIENGDTLLSIIWQNIIPPDSFQTYLGLYNLTDRKWIYEKAHINAPAWNGVLLFPASIYDGKVYMSVGYGLYCHDLWTGNLVWKAKFNAEIFFSGILVENGRVVANCEDKVLYCFGAVNGNLLWTGEGAGTSSPLTDRSLNDIIYFSGGSSGFIHAVDMRNGKTVWKLEPEKMGDGADFWKGDIYVVPGINGEKGKVITMTPMNAYCFEAYR
ncbi:MAG: PQQ-binding-like beta-propeller repeat protein, partial [Saprospiraceae bacterium]